jgi:DNA mismatch repair protein MutL
MDSAASLGAAPFWTQHRPSSEHGESGAGFGVQGPTHDGGPRTAYYVPSNAEAPADTPLDVPILIQLRRTYMMFETEQGVVLIDQHSAHERVLYEQFMDAFDSGASPSQRLLFPLTLQLTPAESEALDAHRDLLQSLGYEIGDFGGHTLIVHAVPAPHPRFDAERCLRDTLAALTGDRGAATASRHQRLASTVACKAAVKAGDALSVAEMRALYVALHGCRLPAHDVHGRQAIVQLSWDELERRFGRR